MRRDGVDYMRCLDCDAVLESEDLEQLPVYDDEEEEPQRKRASDWMVCPQALRLSSASTFASLLV